MTDHHHRCIWAQGSAAERDYHDHEWGVPLHDDQRLFEFLILEGAQAGLSWSTILNKRDGYRAAFDDFDPLLVASYDEQRIAQLLQNPAIVRNKLKLQSAVRNARAFLALQAQHGSFDSFIWDFVDGQPIQNQWADASQVPASSELSDRISKQLKRRGFNFVGGTICYAFMQATGMVNDHTVDCYRHRELGG